MKRTLQFRRIVPPDLRTPALAAMIAVAIAGCSWRGADGTRHQVILGVGLVSTHTQPGVTAQDFRSLGLLACSNGGALGYTRLHRVELDSQVASNAVVAIRSGLGGLTVTNFAVIQTRLQTNTP